MFFLHSKFDQVSEIKDKHALVGSFGMSFDYNVPIPVEKVSKKVQMERYQTFQNSLEARQFDSVILRDNELKIMRHLRQAISLSAKSRCLVTQCNDCANPTTLNQVRSLRRGQNRSIWPFSTQVFEVTGTLYLEINKEGL